MAISCVNIISWTAILLIIAGDVKLNPGPSSNNSSLNSSQDAVSKLINSNHYLSCIHYNIQSIQHKLDILYTELNEFDVLSFSETWLGPTISTTDLLLPSYSSPERLDREGDSHGGVIVYLKNNIYYRRRHDLEINKLECIWVEITTINKQHILIGTIYRPPNADLSYFSLIEHSLDLVKSSGIPNIILMGDLNFDVLSPSKP